MDANDLKLIVKNKYSEIANQSKERNESSCCGSTGCCSTVDYKVFSEEYNKLEGYNPEADLGLGCGLPTAYAQIKEGDTVVDLGSGAGNDCFVARAIVGESGRIIGIDMTEAMIEKARNNAMKLKYSNVEFVFGDIENMPLPSEIADVVISNCVLNLVPDKAKAFGEIFRILKPGSHLSVSDIVLKNELPLELKKVAELYAGCVSGAMFIDDYLEVIKTAGFMKISVQKEKQVPLPTEILREYISMDEIERYRKQGSGISSITVYAEKPAN